MGGSTGIFKCCLASALYRDGHLPVDGERPCSAFLAEPKKFWIKACIFLRKQLVVSSTTSVILDPIVQERGEGFVPVFGGW